MVNYSEINSLPSVISCDELPSGEFCVSTDTRTISEGDLFIAITGEKFNAMNFLDQVIASGVSTVAYSDSDINNDMAKKYPNINFIKTTNSIIFLQEVGNKWSRNFQDAGGKVICISGSNGKTTTKEMLYHILNDIGVNIECTQKNNNNHIGVPLTLFQINKKTDAIIVELGSNHPGEIKTVCDIASPQVAYTTNIGHTHLEFFDSLKAVYDEESYPHLSIANNQESLFFLQNIDDEYLAQLSINEKTKTIGENSKNYNIEYLDESIKINEDLISNMNITGDHNLFNLAASVVLAQNLYPSKRKEILIAAKSFVPTANRSEWIDYRNVKIFLDAYNANPSSMKAALSGFSKIAKNKDKSLIVIGEMFELGRHSEELHRDVAKFVNDASFPNIVFVGSLGKIFQDVCTVAKVYHSAGDFKKDFTFALSQYEYVFIKGSRSLQLESLIDIT